jgi:hypothetical protein
MFLLLDNYFPVVAKNLTSEEKERNQTPHNFLLLFFFIYKESSHVRPFRKSYQDKKKCFYQIIWDFWSYYTHFHVFYVTLSELLKISFNK